MCRSGRDRRQQGRIGAGDAPSQARWTSATDPGAVDDVVARLCVLRPQLIVMEATGGYEGPLAAACAAAGLPVAVVNPRQVRAFAQAIGLYRQDRPHRRGSAGAVRRAGAAAGAAAAECGDHAARAARGPPTAVT